MTEHTGDVPDLPLDELRSAWSSLEAPEPRPDAATVASVEWMRAAWRALPVPAADPSVLVSRRRRAERQTIATWAAAATVLLAGIAFSVQRLTPPARSGVEVTAIGGEPSSTKPYIAAVESDRVEMRSGPVRLILLTNDPEPRGTDL